MGRGPPCAEAGGRLPGLPGPGPDPPGLGQARSGPAQGRGAGHPGRPDRAHGDDRGPGQRGRQDPDHPVRQRRTQPGHPAQPQAGPRSGAEGGPPGPDLEGTAAQGVPGVVPGPHPGAAGPGPGPGPGPDAPGLQPGPRRPGEPEAGAEAQRQGPLRRGGNGLAAAGGRRPAGPAGRARTGAVRSLLGPSPGCPPEPGQPEPGRASERGVRRGARGLHRLQGRSAPGPAGSGGRGLAGTVPGLPKAGPDRTGPGHQPGSPHHPQGRHGGAGPSAGAGPGWQHQCRPGAPARTRRRDQAPPLGRRGRPAPQPGQAVPAQHRPHPHDPGPAQLHRPQPGTQCGPADHRPGRHCHQPVHGTGHPVGPGLQRPGRRYRRVAHPGPGHAFAQGSGHRRGGDHPGFGPGRFQPLCCQVPGLPHPQGQAGPGRPCQDPETAAGGAAEGPAGPVLPRRQAAEPRGGPPPGEAVPGDPPGPARHHRPGSAGGWQPGRPGPALRKDHLACGAECHGEGGHLALFLAGPSGGWPGARPQLCDLRPGPGPTG